MTKIIKNFLIVTLSICTLILCNACTSKNIKYQVEYVLDGGELSGEYVTSFKQNEGLSNLPIPTKENYEFEGWLLDDQIIDNIPKGYVGDKLVTLTAKWKIISTIEISLSQSLISIGDVSFLTIEGYSASEVEVSANNECISIDRWLTVTGLSKGISEITVLVKNDSSKIGRVVIEVIDKSPIIFTSSTKLTIDNKTYFNIKNLSATSAQGLDDFTWSLSDNEIARLNDDFSITGLKIGTTILTACLKSDPRVMGTLQINVVDPYETLVLNTLDSEYIFNQGDVFEINILGDNFNKNKELVWSSSNLEVLRIIEDGRIIAVKEGISSINVYEKGNSSNRTSFHIMVKPNDNVDYIGNFLSIAFSQVGYVEGFNNDTKYGIWYKMNNEPWCAMFVSWCWYQAGLSNDLLLKYCGCYTGQEWCISQGIFNYKANYTPKGGDIIFFTSAGMSHTGICAYVEGGYMYTIEGNSSNKVGIWRWSLKDARITGYASPKYPSFSGKSKDFSFLKGKDENGNYYWTEVSEKQPVT